MTCFRSTRLMPPRSLQGFVGLTKLVDDHLLGGNAVVKMAFGRFKLLFEGQNTSFDVIAGVSSRPAHQLVGPGLISSDDFGQCNFAVVEYKPENGSDLVGLGFGKGHCYAFQVFGKRHIAMAE